MRLLNSILLAFPLVVSTVFPLAASGNDNTDSSWNFVLKGASGEFDGATLHLHEVLEKTTAYSDRPQRTVQSSTVQGLVDQVWSERQDGFKLDPPNAVLVFISDQVTDYAVVEIKDPQIDGQRISFNMKILEGKVPEDFKGPVLIIDPAWNPAPGG